MIALEILLIAMFLIMFTFILVRISNKQGRDVDVAKHKAKKSTTGH